jgi:transcription initiation factor TFIIB
MRERVRQQEESQEGICDECGSEEIVDEGQETICGECGLVLDENNIDHGPEWRAFNHKDREKKSRVGSPMTNTMHDRGLTTVMGDDHTDVSDRRQERLNRMREWDNRSKQTSKERGLKFALGEVQRMVSALDLSKSIHEDAAVIFRQAHQEDLVIGRSYEGMASAAMYIACRRNDNPRTISEIDSVSRVEEQRILRSYKKIQRKLDSVSIEPTDPEAFVGRFVNSLSSKHGLTNKQTNDLETATRHFVKKTKERGLHSGRPPATVVAGAVYMAVEKMDIELTQAEVGEPCDVTPVSIRSMYATQRDEFELNRTNLSVNVSGVERDVGVWLKENTKGFGHEDFKAPISKEEVYRPSFTVPPNWIVDVVMKADDKAHAQCYEVQKRMKEEWDYIVVTDSDRELPCDVKISPDSLDELDNWIDQ